MARWEQKTFSDPFGVHRGPGAALVVEVHSSWSASSDEAGTIAEYLGADVQAEFQELNLQWHQRFQPAPPQLVAPNGAGTARHTIVLPWDTAFIRAVEEARAKRPGDFTLQLRLTTHYRLLARQQQKVGGCESYVSSSAQTDHGNNIRISVSRDAWIRALGQMGWGAFEIFEVPVRQMNEHAPFKNGIALLKAAQAKFLAGDWQGTLLNARHACEAAVVTHAGSAEQPEQDIKVAFEKLGARLFPADVDAPRRDLLGQLFRSINTLRHMGAHGTDPRFRVRREDAELALALAVEVFRYIGETMALEPTR